MRMTASSGSRAEWKHTRWKGKVFDLMPWGSRPLVTTVQHTAVASDVLRCAVHGGATIAIQR